VKLVYCYQCGYYKYPIQFFRYNFELDKLTDSKDNYICNTCAKVNESNFQKVEKILDGVKIPQYSKPVTKYKIESLVLASTE
jgi:hypothetical protein